MEEFFFKFPSTPHLAILGNTDVRNDKVMSEQERNEFLQHELTVEEKVDGANLGISFDISGNIKVQNRGSYLHHPYGGQWKKLSEWLDYRFDTLFEKLTDRYILFGEWCYAQHSIFYNHLPDWLLGFDILDKQNLQFLSCQRRNVFLHDLDIYQVPTIKQGHFSLSQLEELLSTSHLSNEPAEGIYLRYDKDEWLEQRAKLVRPEFIQSIEEHWSKTGIKPNRIQ